MSTRSIHLPLSDIGLVSITIISFSNIYYIPNITLSLHSISQLCDFNYSFKFFFPLVIVCEIHNLSGRLRQIVDKGGFMF